MHGKKRLFNHVVITVGCHSRVFGRRINAILDIHLKFTRNKETVKKKHGICEVKNEGQLKGRVHFHGKLTEERFIVGQIGWRGI